MSALSRLACDDAKLARVRAEFLECLGALLLRAVAKPKVEKKSFNDVSDSEDEDESERRRLKHWELGLVHILLSFCASEDLSGPAFKYLTEVSRAKIGIELAVASKAGPKVGNVWWEGDGLEAPVPKNVENAVKDLDLSERGAAKAYLRSLMQGYGIIMVRILHGFRCYKFLALYLACILGYLASLIC